LEAVHSALNHLMRREPPLVKVLPRQPGTKEARYMQLLGGDAAPVQHLESEPEGESAAMARSGVNDSERVGQLESEVADLKRELADLREQFAVFQKQFQ
jgi:uncharacterized protein